MDSFLQSDHIIYSQDLPSSKSSIVIDVFNVFPSNVREGCSSST